MKNNSIKKEAKKEVLFILSIITFLILAFGICHLWDFGTFLITIIGGIFVAVAVLLTQEIYYDNKLKSNFKWLRGDWDGGWKLEGRNVIQDTYSSKGTIIYEGGNILSISLTHENKQEKPSDPKERTWQAQIEMNKQIINRGSIVFKYTDSHESGYKEILISSDNEHDYIYLFPVILDGKNTMNCGIQVLKRNRK